MHQLDGVHKQQFLALVDCIAAQDHTQILFVSHVEELPQCINQWLQLVPHAQVSLRRWLRINL